MDGHLEPLSPAPSLDTLGLEQTIEHNDTEAASGSGRGMTKTAAVTQDAYTTYGSSPAHHSVGDFGSAAPVYVFPAEEADMVSLNPRTLRWRGRLSSCTTDG